jgi:hypothetical protein
LHVLDVVSQTNADVNVWLDPPSVLTPVNVVVPHDRVPILVLQDALIPPLAVLLHVACVLELVARHSTAVDVQSAIVVHA